MPPFAPPTLDEDFLRMLVKNQGGDPSDAPPAVAQAFQSRAAGDAPRPYPQQAPDDAVVGGLNAKFPDEAPAPREQPDAHTTTVTTGSGTTSYDYARQPGGGLSQVGQPRFQSAQTPEQRTQDQIRAAIRQSQDTLGPSSLTTLDTILNPFAADHALAQRNAGVSGLAGQILGQQNAAEAFRQEDLNRQNRLQVAQVKPHTDTAALKAQALAHLASQALQAPGGFDPVKFKAAADAVSGSLDHGQPAAGGVHSNTQSATAPGTQTVLAAEPVAAEIKKLFEGGVNRENTTQALDRLANLDPATQAEFIRRLADQNLAGDTTVFGDNVVKSLARTQTALYNPINPGLNVPGTLGLPDVGLSLQRTASPLREGARTLFNGLDPTAAYTQASVNNGKRIVPLDPGDVSGQIERLRMSPAERQAAQKRSAFGADLIRQLTARGKYAQ